MSISRKVFSELISNFRFKELFNELGWDHVVKQVPVAVDNKVYKLEAVAQKKDFMIFVCSNETAFPDRNARKVIDRKISALFYEHLIIFINNQKQVWQLAVKEPNKPIQYKQTEYFIHQAPELLFQKLKGLIFTLEEEDKIGLLDVTFRVAEHFNVNTEKTTKKFYDGFKKQHKAFMGFINGLENQLNIDWYTSLMLNRLMFIYFIQKKGFLNNDVHYLRNKLKQTRKQFGANKFYSFYKTFLLVLFHKGLGDKSREDKQLVELIGQVPYLDGGLFDVHQLEKEKKNINIDDAAFEKLFNFFDGYQWHLDTRRQASGNEINPDVIGYIFEKYINDRAAMGAYYTKEDITEYISKNTIIPFLFDQAKKGCANAFKKESGLCLLLKENPDRYIYDAVKKGCELDDIPENIARGINTDKPELLERRKDWNTRTPEKYGLPTEIWRETIARRQRYFEIRAKLSSGEITAINDFITYNLNIRQFAQDAIEYYEGSDLINSFFNAITKIKILDPTCGSGAFLFAALNILEPLYEGCIARMREFVEQDDTSGKGKKFGAFRNVMLDIDRHPNQKYWILKSIILNNLYGVDTMHEAVEIAKLRLFLKLAATADVDYGKENLGLEPLPDIDFNIRAGNTLVGFASEEHLLEAVKYDKDGQYRIGYEAILDKFKEECEVVGMAFKRFKEAQLVEDPSSENFKQTKNELGKRLAELNDQLNKYLAGTYGVVTSNKKEYEKWLASHKPFHWFAEFYEIVQGNGGFDVIIGNPPYVEYSKVKKVYTIKGYETEKCGNLYAFILERSLSFLILNGYQCLIVPISIVCTQRMGEIQNFIQRKTCISWHSNYAERPAKLFHGAEVLLTISLLSTKSYTWNKHYVTGLRKWTSEQRHILFDSLEYFEFSNKIGTYIFPKISSYLERNIIIKIYEKGDLLGKLFMRNAKNKIYYRIGGGRYWKIFTTFQPRFVLNDKKSISSRENYLYFEDIKNRDHTISVLSSTLFYWYFLLTTNGRDLNPSDLSRFPAPINTTNNNIIDLSTMLSNDLMQDYQANKVVKKKVSKKTGVIQYEEFYPRKSKHIIDEIDKILAKHYGFTEEELDFIINYDIKYRMGKELNQ